MATLGDTGSTQVNENNPYQVALANSKAQSSPIYPKAQLNSSLLTPASTAYENAVTAPGKGSPLVGTTAVKDIDANAPVPDDSTENTPEARPADQAKQHAAANLQNINHAIDPSATPKTKLPTEQQNVDAALAPDQQLLSGLSAEYKSALASLAPYINSGQDTGNAALNAADKEVADVTNQSEGPVEKALGGLAKAGKEYEGTVPYQGIIQALLGQSKYDITYNNAQPGNKADWNTTMDDIYAYLSGSNQSTNGLPPPATAASTGTPSTASDSAGGGNA